MPHPPSMTDQNVVWQEEIDLLKGQGVKVKWQIQFDIRIQQGNYFSGPCFKLSG